MVSTGFIASNGNKLPGKHQLSRAFSLKSPVIKNCYAKNDIAVS
jgi:hypothetical protein